MTYVRMQNPAHRTALVQMSPEDVRALLVDESDAAALEGAGWHRLGGPDLVEMTTGGSETVLVPADQVGARRGDGWSIV